MKSDLILGNLNQVSHASLDKNIAGVLRESILSGDLKPGVRLPQEHLANHFKVSRIPVREALQQLESEGLILIEPRHGATVSALSADEIKEMFEMRAALESFLIEKAIPMLTTQDFKQAETLLGRMDRTKSAKVWVKQNAEFHERLYSAAGRPLILAQVEMLRRNLARYIQMNISRFSKQDLASSEHHAILNACIDGDAEKAGKLTREHLLSVGAQLEELLRVQAGITPASI